MNVLDQLKARRFELRQAIERVPVVGPVLLQALRRGKKAWSRPEQPQVDVEPLRFKAALAKMRDSAGLERVDDPVKKLHADFALSTVRRGRMVAKRMQTVTSISGKSYLDVGCAYGGFLVAFAEAGARRIVGIDINSGSLACAAALMEDYRLQPDVRKLDVLDEDRSAELGRFDLITCNDVIEHVADPARALSRLGALLAEGGTLYMEIPNRWSAKFILSDGHYRVFGLTALPKKAADQYALEMIEQSQDVIYKSLPFYINTLAKLGCVCRLADGTPADLTTHLEQVASTFKACEAQVQREIPRASVESTKSLRLHVPRTARAFHRGHAKYKSLLQTDRAAANRLGRKLYLVFGIDFWTLYVQRRSGPVRRVSWSKELG